MRFKDWLNEQLSQLERNEIELYHGTTTGKNDEKLNSFKQGIKPLSSNGFNQGAGYYTFSDQDAAKSQAIALRRSAGIPWDGPKVGPDTVTGSGHGGSPMVVTHKTILNPRDYDLDRELQSADIVKFMSSKVDEIDQLLKQSPITLPTSQTSVASSNLISMFSMPEKGCIGFWLVDPEAIDTSKAQRDKEYVIYTSKGDIYEAEELNTILKELTSKSASLANDYKAFIRSIMKQVSRGNAQPRAFKYVGDKQISPNKIMTHANNQWT